MPVMAEAAPPEAVIRAQILTIYVQHNPRKVADVDALLAEWAGEEGMLLQQIKAKYRPQILAQVRQRMVTIYEQHNPRKVADVDALLAEWVGEEETLLEHVQAKYGVASAPEPAAAEPEPEPEPEPEAQAAQAAEEEEVALEEAWTPSVGWTPELHEKLLSSPTAARKGKLPPLNI